MSQGALVWKLMSSPAPCSAAIACEKGNVAAKRFEQRPYHVIYWKIVCVHKCGR